VEQITVRRWVAATPEEVWRHLFDLQQLAVDDPTLDLESLLEDDVDGESVPAPGTVATVSRRRGHRVERFELHVEGRTEPSHLSVSVSAAGERWLITVTVEALAGGGSDVRFHAERDPVGILLRDPRSGRRHRVAHSVGVLLDGLARQLDGSRALQTT
jgi:hypothetical protein